MDPMDSPEQKRRIFLHATESADPSGTVLVQAGCLLAALGEEAAQELLPHVGLAVLIDKGRAAVDREVARLKAEVERLAEQAALGFSNAKRELGGAQSQLQQASTGRIQSPALVRVHVGPFRAALQAAIASE